MEGVSAGLGLLGLIQGQKAQSEQNKLIKKGMKGDEAIKAMQLEGMKEMAGLARDYNPAGETATAIAGAREQTGKTLEQSLRNLRAEYARYGADPSMTSKWNMDTNSVTRRVTDPFTQFALERSTGDTQRKMAAWQAAIGSAPGNFSDSYFNAAKMIQPPSMGGSMMSIVQALMGMRGSGGAGGSGDWRSNQKSNAGGWNA